MSQDPDQIRSEIEQTRAGLATDVNLLTEKVSPARVVERRVDSAKEAVGNLTGKVFGRDDSPQPDIHAPSDGALSSATDAVRNSPELAKDKATGSPLIAGAIAFGVGYLASTLLPASRRERQAARQLTDQLQELKEPVQQQVKAIAAEVKQDLQPQVEQAAAAVKDTAAQAATEVRGSASEAGERVSDQTKQAAGTVKEQASSTEPEMGDSPGAPRFTPYPTDPVTQKLPTSGPFPGGLPPR